MLTQRAFAGPETLREFLIDHHNLWRGAVIVFFKETALHERDLHGVEIARAGKAKIDLQFLAGRRSISFHFDVPPTNGSSQGQCRNLAF